MCVCVYVHTFECMHVLRAHVQYCDDQAAGSCWKTKVCVCVCTCVCVCVCAYACLPAVWPVQIKRVRAWLNSEGLQERSCVFINIIIHVRIFVLMFKSFYKLHF